MFIDRDFDEYPFKGSFYEYRIDLDAPLDEQVEEEVLVLDTVCDIQESSKTDAYGVLLSSFNVYFPFSKNKGINIKKGMTFVGSKFGIQISGLVVGVDASMLGGAVCYIKDNES